MIEIKDVEIEKSHRQKNIYYVKVEDFEYRIEITHSDKQIHEVEFEGKLIHGTIPVIPLKAIVAVIEKEGYKL
jgi:hypothetical protein